MCVQKKKNPVFFQFHLASLYWSDFKLGTVQHKVDLKMTGHLIRMAVLDQK